MKRAAGLAVAAGFCVAMSAGCGAGSRDGARDTMVYQGAEVEHANNLCEIGKDPASGDTYLATFIQGSNKRAARFYVNDTGDGKEVAYFAGAGRYPYEGMSNLSSLRRLMKPMSYEHLWNRLCRKLETRLLRTHMFNYAV